MQEIKKIIAFSKGDSNQCSTWSNVPYFYLKNLEIQGLEIVRVNTQLEDDNLILKKLMKIINAVIRRTFRLFVKNSTAMNTIDRSRLYEILESFRINKAISKNPDAQIAFFFYFSHSLKNKGNMKVVLFCDWTIEYEIISHQNRSPNYFEKKVINRQRYHMEQADCIITLFPNVYDELVKEFGREKVFYLGNVINSEIDSHVDGSSLALTHYRSNRIIMIGRKAYKSGLLQLFQAVKNYNTSRSEEEHLYIDVIGMTDKEAGIIDDHITYYGYLNKNEEAQKATYYNLIKNAKVICNTTENWIGASSIIEAMYWRLPVILNPTEDIYKIFGRDISFGKYVYKNEAKVILDALEWISSLNEVEYCATCNASYEAVKNFTWESYAVRTVELMKRL